MSQSENNPYPFRFVNPVINTFQVDMGSSAEHKAIQERLKQIEISKAIHNKVDNINGHPLNNRK